MIKFKKYDMSNITNKREREAKDKTESLNVFLLRIRFQVRLNLLCTHIIPWRNNIGIRLVQRDFRNCHLALSVKEMIFFLFFAWRTAIDPRFIAIKFSRRAIDLPEIPRNDSTERPLKPVS